MSSQLSLAPSVYLEAGAEFSTCGRYRWALTRTWAPLSPAVLFVGLNPSTANATDDDPTIRRCVGFAKRWDCGRLLMGNLFALRATDPQELHRWARGGLRVADLIGSENNAALLRMAREALHVVAAWGTHGVLGGRDREVRALLPPLTWTLGLTKDGHPRHPLYVAADTPRALLTPSHAA